MSDGPGPTLTKISGSAHGYFCFDSILYIPFNNFSAISGRVFLGSTSTKQRVMCFAQGHNELNAVVQVRLKLESLGLESSTLALTHCAAVFFFITTVHLHMVGRTSMCTEQKKKRKLTLNVLLPIYMYTYAFIIHVTEYERLKIKIPVEGSFEFYRHFIPPFCLIFFKTLILVNYSPQYDDVQNL